MLDVELLSFVRRMLDREQRAAEALPNEKWHVGERSDPRAQCNIHAFPSAREVVNGVGLLTAEHIILHGPTHVLRDLDFKQAVLAIYENSAKTGVTPELESSFEFWRYVVEQMACVWRDADGFDPRWDR